MFIASQVANVDWDLVAAAAATFIVTAIATALGFRKGINKVGKSPTEVTPIQGASLMDNMSMVMLTEAIKENTDIQRDVHSCLVQQNTLLQIGLNKRD